MCVVHTADRFIGTTVVSDANIALIPSLVISFIIYHFLLKTDIIKEIFMYLTVIAMISYISSISYFFDAFVQPNGTYESFSYQATVFQLIWCLICALGAGPLLAKYYGWLVDNYSITKIWLLMCIIPICVIIFSFSLVPIQYKNIYVGKIKEIYIVTHIIVLVISAFIYVLFYRIAKTANNMSKLQKTNQLLGIQANQYASLTEHVNEMRRVRHDFRHQLTTLSGLAEKSNDVEIQKYISHYLDTTSTSILQFSSNNALNSILTYYYDKACLRNIHTDIKVHLFDKLIVDQVEFCSIIGNLFENAVNACEHVLPDKRFINLAIANTNKNTIAIKISNSYGEKIIKQNNKFISTKHNGNGIGIESVRATTRKYNGTINITTDNNCFSVSILLFCS